MTPCLPLSTVPAPAPGRRPCRTPCPGRKSSGGSTSSWRSRTAIHAGYAGRTVRVLVDGESGDGDYPLSSRTEGNRLVRLKGDPALIGRFLEVRITGSNTWALYGEPV